MDFEEQTENKRDIRRYIYRELSQHSQIQNVVFIQKWVSYVFCLPQIDTLSFILFKMVFQDGCVDKRKRFLGGENGINKNMTHKRESTALFRQEQQES